VAKRELQEYTRRRRLEVKTHHPMRHAPASP
jgi:hypothetical protein